MIDPIIRYSQPFINTSTPTLTEMALFSFWEIKFQAQLETLAILLAEISEPLFPSRSMSRFYN